MLTKKQTALNFAFIITLSAALFWFSFEREGTYNRLFLSFDADKLPCTEVVIQGQHYLAKLSLGADFPLSLNKTALAQLEKKDAGKVWIKDLFGENIEFQTYRIDEIRLGNLCMKDVLVLEKEGEHELGAIGRPLLTRYNLLLDFRKSTLIMTNRFKHLEKVGYGREDWVRTPIQLGPAGVVLKTTTDRGTAHLSLGFATVNSLIKPVSYNSEEELPTHFSMSRFLIGETNFGTLDFHPCPIANTHLSEVDGILGMDFLYRHLTYLDFDNQCAYITR